jgi:predicted NBD/HSP70 family sugar kinase
MEIKPQNKPLSINRTYKKGQDLAGLRSSNMALVLSTIWQNAPTSRAYLAKKTGLAVSSVTRLIRQLVENDLVVEAGKGKSSGGRTPKLIMPNPNAGVVLSIDLSSSSLRGGVFNAFNQEIFVEQIPFTDLGSEPLTEQIFSMLDSLQSQSGMHGQKILGIGVSTPGVIDAKNGVVLEAYNLHLSNYPLQAILEERYHLLVNIQTDTSVAAIAEKYYGSAQDFERFVYLLVSNGIGFGIYLNGQLYEGENGIPGRSGHIIVDRNGPVCICGNRGCLETVANRPAIISNAKRILKNNRDPILQEVIDGDSGSLSLQHITHAAEAGSNFAMELIRTTADHLAFAMRNTSVAMGIQNFVIGGEASIDLGPLFLDSIREYLRHYQKFDPAINVVPTQLGYDSFLKGVSLMTLQQVFGISN